MAESGGPSLWLHSVVSELPCVGRGENCQVCAECPCLFIRTPTPKPLPMPLSSWAQTATQAQAEVLRTAQGQRPSLGKFGE